MKVKLNNYMTTHITFKLTRPSLDHRFLLEIIENMTLLEFPSNYYEYQAIKRLGKIDGLVDTYHDEVISWEEIYARKDELRSDLRDWLVENHFNIQKNFQLSNDSSSTGPLLNPFSLTFTKHIIFDTMENATAYIIKHREFDPSKTDNTVEIYVNEQPIDIFNL
jgi:hypothetical protein